MRALEILNFLSAVDDEGNLTALGEIMARFPLDPQVSAVTPRKSTTLTQLLQLAKMLIVSPDFECSNEILTIVSMLSGTPVVTIVPFLGSYFSTLVPNVWLRPKNQRKEADEARALLTIPDGDHLTLLNVYNSWIQSACMWPLSTLIPTECSYY